MLEFQRNATSVYNLTRLKCEMNVGIESAGGWAIK